MRYIFLYTSFLISMILQLNAGRLGLILPFVFSFALFSTMIVPWWQSSIFVVLSALSVDVFSCGNDFSYTLASLPFAFLIPLSSVWMRKNRPPKVLLPLYGIIPSALFFVIYILSASVFASPNYYMFFLSMPVYLLAGGAFFFLNSLFVGGLGIREPDRRVF
jgi:hypothetical protein